MTRAHGGIVVVAVVVALATGGGCWPGWDFLFDQTPSREHRVEDMRVLAVAADPASILVPPSFLDGTGDPLVLDVAPAIFDPRGGDIDVGIRICPHSIRTPVPCAEADPHVVLPHFDATATADPRVSLGTAPVNAQLALTTADVRALFVGVGLRSTSVLPVPVDVVVNVARILDGKRESETAFITLTMQLDSVALPAAQADALVHDAGGVNCTPAQAGLGCTGGGASTCGNGVIEGDETCDPPVADACAPSCQALDRCAAARAPVCFVPPTTLHRSRILGAFANDSEGAAPADGEHIDIGGTIAVPAGGRFLVPDFQIDDGSALLQSSFFEPDCAPGTRGAVPQLACSRSDINTWRAYIADGHAELIAPANPDKTFVGNSFLTTPVGVAFTKDTPAGTREPFVFVLVDDYGGMDVATFTIEAQ